jgi:hypothetical protein
MSGYCTHSSSPVGPVQIFSSALLDVHAWAIAYQLIRPHRPPTIRVTVAVTLFVGPVVTVLVIVTIGAVVGLPGTVRVYLIVDAAQLLLVVDKALVVEFEAEVIMESTKVELL